MKLTGFEIIDQGGPDAIKSWLVAMNGAAKKGEAIFEVAGERTLPARSRTGAAKGASSSTQWSFKGGERMSIQQVYQEPNIHRDSTVLKVTLVPAATELKMLKDGFASMSMDLEKAFDVFEGLEDWVGKMSEAGKRLPKRGGVQQFVEAPKADEFRESEEWGAW